jgi:hypothetical protein
VNKFLGITLVVLGIAIAVVPNFTDCASQGLMTTNAAGKPMQMMCHWAGRAEIAVGAPLFAIGGVMAFAQRRSSLFSLAILGSILGVVAILLPTNIIGTCGTPTMHCNTVMKPALTGLGALAIVGSLGGLILARRAKQ